MNDTPIVAAGAAIPMMPDVGYGDNGLAKSLHEKAG